MGDGYFTAPSSTGRLRTYFVYNYQAVFRTNRENIKDQYHLHIKRSPFKNEVNYLNQCPYLSNS